MNGRLAGFAALVACAGIVPVGSALGSLVQTGASVQWGPTQGEVTGPFQTGGASTALSHGYAAGPDGWFAGEAAAIASFGSVGTRAQASLEHMGSAPAVHLVAAGARFRDELTFAPFASSGSRGGAEPAFVTFTFKIWGTIEVDAPGFATTAYAQLYVGDKWSHRFETSQNGAMVQTVYFPIVPDEPFILDVSLAAGILLDRTGAAMPATKASASVLVDFGNTAHVSEVVLYDQAANPLRDYVVMGASGVTYPVPGPGVLFVAAAAGIVAGLRRRR